MAALRFTPNAAQRLRDAIREAGGVEVFAIGDVDLFGRVSHLEVHCRGTEGAVPALMERPRTGQVVIHNHPSGDLRPSDADFHLANRYGDEGIGVIIVDSGVRKDNWVVEPAKKQRHPIDRLALANFFQVGLPRAMPDAEARPAQRLMAEQVADALDGGQPLVVEAGTGTGKSLAYLVPAILWAQANDSKVAVSTYTRTLQGQLWSSDLPLARKGGLEFEAALLKGRGNYLCRRKLAAAQADGVDAETLQRISDWAATAEEGSMQDMSFDVEGELWERVQSDSDQTLRTRCPHYNQCFYYRARRKAAAAHVLVLNHALLLSDLHIKGQTGGDGIVPRYSRVILDEAHHLQDAATSVTSQRATAKSIQRAINPLLSRRRREGALKKVAGRFGSKAPQIVERAEMAIDQATAVRDQLQGGFDHVGIKLLGGKPQRRINYQDHQGADWQDAAATVAEMANDLRELHDRLGSILQTLEECNIPVDQAQPVMDVQRAVRRIGAKHKEMRAFLEQAEGQVRYIEQDRRHAVALCQAPVDVAPLLDDILWSRMEGAAATSATLAVQDSFAHFFEASGVEDAITSKLPSPFSYRDQALLALPRDLPRPEASDYIERVGDVLVDLVRASQGGAFVLCTSYAAVRAFGTRLERELGDRYPVLQQGKSGRERLLHRFKESHGAILVGTDSFWEGVSVKGEGLRLVVIPKLPFRVPTEPVAQARHQRVRAQGRDPFRVLSLPEAVLKLRQGFGRLVRSQSDRGVVAILDRRLHEMWYGRLFINALPDARRVTGPARVVLPQVQAFFEEQRAGITLPPR
ncbi:MAG: ATP-dependent DNA helicase DinG [Cognaticolwellia sp.]|jgi:ATP-dependent DNA helicase DinG